MTTTATYRYKLMGSRLMISDLTLKGTATVTTN